MDIDFANIIGNEPAKGYLRQMIASGRIGNSLLFCGCDGVGKGLFALAVARCLLGNNREIQSHPDLHIYRPEGKIAMHSIDAVRSLTEQVFRYPFEATKQVLIVHDAERMLPTSANALLKTFEEPSPQAVIILLSSNPQGLLPTIRSRCRTLPFQPVAEQAIAQMLTERHSCLTERAQAIAAQAKGSVAKAIDLFRGGDSRWRAHLLELLAAGEVNTYKALGEALQPICEAFDAYKALLETNVKESTRSALWQEMSLTQKEAYQKEMDGVVALRFREEVYALLIDVLDWYRDINVIQTGSHPRYLMHRQSEPSLRAASKNKVKSLEQVESAVQAVKISMERFTPLKTCLESLFLKLDFI